MLAAAIGTVYALEDAALLQLDRRGQLVVPVDVRTAGSPFSVMSRRTNPMVFVASVSYWASTSDPRLLSRSIARILLLCSSIERNVNRHAFLVLRAERAA